jgi:hypothetical protein
MSDDFDPDAWLKSTAAVATATPYDSNFNTVLSPDEEQQYQTWKAKYAPDDDGSDYDLKGAFKAGLTPDPKRGHFPDTFKKPNHPTFSNESEYNGLPDGKGETYQGGAWGQDDSFTAGPTNIAQHGNNLADYFKRVEPNSKLIMPAAAAAPDISNFDPDAYLTGTDRGKGDDLLTRVEKGTGHIVGGTMQALAHLADPLTPVRNQLAPITELVEDAATLGGHPDTAAQLQAATQNPVEQGGKILKEKADALQTNPAFAADPSSKVADVVGNVLPYVNPVSVPVMGLSGYQQGFDDAKAKGLDDDAAARAGTINATVDAGVGKVLGPIKWLEESGAALSKPTLAAIAKDLTASAVKGVVRGGAEGGIMSAGHQVAVGDNPLSEASLKEDLESAETNAIVGGVMGPGFRGLGIADQLRKPGTAPVQPDAPVPESPAAIDFQMKQLASGNRPAVMIAPGGDVPPAPDGTAIYENKAGTFIYNPNKITDDEIDAAASNGRLGDVLGYPTPSKPANATQVQTLQSPSGAEKLSLLADDETAPKVKGYLEAQAEPGDTVVTRTPDEAASVIEQRLQQKPAPKPDEMTPEQFDASEAERAEQLRSQYEQPEPVVRFSRDKTGGSADDSNREPEPAIQPGSDSIGRSVEERAAGGSPEAAAEILRANEEASAGTPGVRQGGFLASNKLLAASRKRARQELDYQDLADRSGKLRDDEGIPEGATLLGQGVEHQVYHRDGEDRVTKLTKPNEYGISIIGHERSTPRSYLERLGMQNKLFGDDIRWEGISGDGRTITSQPRYDELTDEQGNAVHADYPEIAAKMQRHGFRETGGGEWYNPKEKVIATDAHPRNFIKYTDNKIHPIDLQLSRATAEQQAEFDPKYSRGELASTGIHPSEIAAHLREVTGNWKVRPAQVVLPDARSFPDAKVRADILAKGDVEGMYYKDKVYLFADKLPTPADARRVYLHETVGHYGLQKVLGPRFQNFLDQFYNDHQYGLSFDKVAREYGLDLTTPEGRREAVEEYMARLAESNPGASLFKRFVTQLKLIANQVLGTKFGFSEDEAKALLQVSRRALERGEVTGDEPRFSRKGDQDNMDRMEERLSDLNDQLNQLRQRGAMKADIEAVKRQITALTMEKAEARAQMDDETKDTAGKTDDAAGAPAQPAELNSIHPMRLTKAFLGTKDIFNRTKGLEFLGKAIERHVDTARKYQGELLAPFAEWNRTTSRTERKKAYGEYAAYWGARDSTQPDADAFYQLASPAGKKLIDLWRAVSEKTGRLNMLNKLVVWDPQLGEGKGGFRAVGRVKDYFPRTIREDVWDALKRPNKYPNKFEEVWRDLSAAGYAKTKEEALSKINAHFGTESSNDHFGAIESARLLKLPNSLYDYSFDASRRYLMRWAERTAQIEAYGQKVGKNGKDLFDVALDKIEAARKEGRMDEPQAAATGKFINAVRDRAYGKKYNGPIWSAIGVLNAVATGTQLTNPVTIGINLLSGIGYNFTFLGTRHALAGLADIRTVGRLFNQIHDGVERGAIQDDLLSMVHDAEEAGGRKEQFAMKAASRALKYTGYNATEYFTRAHTLATAKSFLRTALKVWGNNPGSRTSLQYAAWFQRNGFHVPDLIVENGNGMATDKFLRGAVNDVQGGYRFDQVPVWMDHPLGKFFLKYQKWGSQMARNMWMNVMEPALTGTKVRRLVDGQRVETTVRDFAPLVRFAVTSGLIGWSQDQLKEWLFGRPDRTASFHEIGKTLDENFARGLALVADKYFTHVINAGALGTIGNYLQAGRDVAERSRFKNPMSPPGLSTLNPSAELAMRWKEQGTLTVKDLNDFLVSQVSMLRALQQGGSRLLGALDPDYKKQSNELRRQDMAWLGDITRRYAAEIGQGGSRLSISRVGKNANTPYYDRVNQGLLLGDRNAVREAVKEFLASRPNDDHAAMLKSLMASVRARQPIKIGLSNSESTKEMFLNWAHRRLQPEDVSRIRDIDQAYRLAAVALGLMKPEEPASSKEIEKTLSRVLLQNDTSQAAEIKKAMGH